MLTRAIHLFGGAVCVLIGAPSLLWICSTFGRWPMWTAGLALFGVLLCGALIFFGLALIWQTIDDPETDDAARFDVSVRSKPKQKKEG